jgi:hypothetical protein
MNENYERYVEMGRKVLEERLAAERAAAVAALAERRERNREKWLAHLKPLFDSVPADLHPFFRFDDLREPTYWNGYDLRSHFCSLEYVPFVPIRVEVPVNGGQIDYAVGQAESIESDECDGLYIKYSYHYAYTDIFEAMAMADAVKLHNAGMVARLEDEESVKPVGPVVGPAPLSYLRKAVAAFADDRAGDAKLFALFSIAESLEGVAHSLDNTLSVRNVDSY